MSWLQRIKKNCQNLQKLVISISKEPSRGIEMIEVIKDFNLKYGEGKDDPELTNLKLLNLAGPFGPDITSYLIKGAKLIDNLGLAINWVDPHYCSVQPSSDKDYIGTEYLEELINVNPLPNLYQLHLSGSDEE